MADQPLGDEYFSGTGVSDDAPLAGFGRPEDPVRDAHRNRRVLWSGAGALIVVGALAVPLTLHFVHRAPAHLNTPTRLAGLTLDKTTNAESTADYLRTAIAAGMNLTTSVGAVYTNGGTTAAADAHSVIVVGGTTTGADDTLVTRIMGLMDDSTDGITAISTVDAGSAGGVMKCGLTTDTSQQDASTDTEMAVCGFGDGGKVGIALFPNRTVTDAAALLRKMRPGLE